MVEQERIGSHTEDCAQSPARQSMNSHAVVVDVVVADDALAPRLVDPASIEETRP